jgi:hypothetical protein
MTVERALRAMAGFFVMLSVALGYWVHPGFFLFTGLCPAMWILKQFGLKSCIPQELPKAA